MGNCIGKKSDVQNKHRKHNSSKIVSNSKLHRNNQLNIKSTLPLSLKQTNNRFCRLSNVKESNILFNNNDESEKQIIQYSSSLTTLSNEQLLCSDTLPTLSPVQLSIQCKKFKSNNNVIDFSETNIAYPITLIQNEQDTTMEYVSSEETEINNNNKEEVQTFTQEIILESVGTSPSPTLSDSSFSSLSCNTTSFSSQDRLILSSSCSSTEINPILSSYQLTNSNRFHSLSYNEQIYFDNQSTNEIFSTILPVSFSHCKNDLFLSEFHKNTISHNCKTLSSVIDDIVQQEFIRIHRRTKTILIEHKQFECINLKDLKKFDTPSLIFDEDKKLVYITKYSRWNELKSITYNTKDVPRILSSCDNCSLVLSGSKLNNYLHSYLLANTTYNLVQICFNEINNNRIFGYISQKHSNQIQQTIINCSKLNYSYDLDVDYTSFYFVLHIQSWPQEIRSIYEQRKRFWPLNIENLFHNTCFIRFNDNEQEIFTNDKCFTCEKILLSPSNSSWSYIYSAIEAQLVHTMSDGHIRFASILWNYLNCKTQGQFPFVIFKHTIFYFFERYSSDSFITSDLFSHVHHFIDYLLNCLETKSIPHYFNSNYNLYNENISIILINLISIKMTYLDLKNYSIYILPKSSLYLYHLIYLIQFQMNFLQYYHSLKINLTQTIIDTHEHVIEQLSYGPKIYKTQLASIIAIKSHRPLTLDCLYRYQEKNVQILLDYLPLLREKEPSLHIHLLWSIFIQYFNSLFDDLFIS
ncbi:unnamed protein product [Rotaria sordida]|uniref:Uncharacterized protein n=1 Tax=Rotaria sordida TaxID=392033 RepID=A0A818VWY4_9BILA|nr:unnamed protein product [Rotaria sordida]